MTRETAYQFINHRPGTHLSRNGTRLSLRPASEWKLAYQGHLAVHGGVEDKNCAACKELRKKGGIHG